MKVLKNFVFLAFQAIPLVFGVAEAKKDNCRCLYGDASCWPSREEFSMLASQLSQPLLRPTPPALPCYQESSSSPACADLQAHTGDGIWRSALPGSMQNPNFEAYLFANNRTLAACYLNTALGVPCEQGAVPPVGVDARTPEDLRAAVRFAKEHGLKVVVKNTGHDFLGRSTARGAFLIWTHHMKDVKVHAGDFRPSGAPASEKQYDAITLGAGVQWAEAYSAARVAGRIVVGGASESVGAAGGWVLGGGHSALSAKYGLGVDNVLEFTLVTGSGKDLTANNYENPSLFWALRGGGGGTFGIVTSTTYRTYPDTPLSAAFLQANFSSPELAQDITAAFIQLHPTLAESGWGGYAWPSTTDLRLFYVAPALDTADANRTFNPFFERVANATGSAVPVGFIAPYPSFYTWFDQLFANETGQVGHNLELSSRLVSREAVERRPEDIARIMLSFRGAAWNFVAGGAVAEADPASTGLNPAWRKALAHVYIPEAWPDGTSVEEIEQARQRLREGMKVLDGISVNSAAYLNEASLYEPDFKLSFFGEHYSRLREIKGEVDPDSMFVVPLGVGSEDWDQALECRL